MTAYKNADASVGQDAGAGHNGGAAEDASVRDAGAGQNGDAAEDASLRDAGAGQDGGAAEGLDVVRGLFERRAEPVREFAEQAPQVAAACHDMAIRFHQGGKLVVFGTGLPATDAQHVAVEFVHPVIVGKRALPAMSLTCDVATLTGIAAEQGEAEIFAHQLRYLAESADIALGVSTDGNSASVLAGLRAARERGLLTIALAGCGGGAIAAARVADHVLVTGADDPRIIKELHVTTYHVLWELVHVIFEQPGLLGPEVVR